MKNLISVLIVIVFALPLKAQWLPSNGPYGGNVKCFFSPSSTVYAGTEGNNVMMSENNGLTWTSASSVGLTNSIINCFIKKGAYYFLGTNGGVFLSTNTGATWFAVNSGLFSTIVNTFAIIEENLYAATTGGLYVTSDNGASWQGTGYNITNPNITSLLLYNGTMYAGTLGGGVFKSTDNGASFSSANFGLINQNVNALLLAGSTIYAGASALNNADGIYKTTNNGASWISAGLTNIGVYSLMINSTYLYAGTNAGVHRTPISGGTWTAMPDIRNQIVKALANSGNNILAGSEEGIFLSSNGGTIWDAVGYLTKEASMFTKAGSNLYVSGRGVYRSTNNGNSWYTVNNGLPYLIIRDLTSVGTNIYAAYQNNNLTQNGIYYSTNNGDEWIYRWNTMSRSINVIKARDSIFYIGLYYKSGEQGLYRSNDSGKTFMTDYSSLFYNVGVWDVEFVNANDVYITTSGNNGSIIRSTNYGSNWMLVYSDNGVYKLEISGNYIYGGGSWGTGVIMSSNNGQNWASIGLNDKNINDMAAYGSYLFVSTYDSGIYMTNNNGVNWYNRNQGIPPLYLNQFSDLFISDNYIFAGAGSYGAWRRQMTDIIGVENISTEVPSEYLLEQNYPNPFNPSTKIRFQVRGNHNVMIKVYDIGGREVQTLVNERLQPGIYETTFDGEGLSSGVYFYRMNVGGFTLTKRMVLLK
ncbi:MAG: T9SS type A sorting domain-containing protein [Ignavibacteria bacterium]